MSTIKTETEYTGRALKGQFKQADRLKSKFLIILNDEDLKNNIVQVKNNKTKEEEKVELKDLVNYLYDKLSNYGCSCDCGCQDGEECTCGDDCHCGEECHCHEEE